MFPFISVIQTSQVQGAENRLVGHGGWEEGRMKNGHLE